MQLNDTALFFVSHTPQDFRLALSIPNSLSRLMTP
jgi:hypothetical protein